MWYGPSNRFSGSADGIDPPARQVMANTRKKRFAAFFIVSAPGRGWLRLLSGLLARLTPF